MYTGTGATNDKAANAANDHADKLGNQHPKPAEMPVPNQYALNVGNAAAACLGCKLSDDSGGDDQGD